MVNFIMIFPFELLKQIFKKDIAIFLQNPQKSVLNDEMCRMWHVCSVDIVVIHEGRS